MLGKLIKHDFKSLSRVLFPTQLAVLGASVLAAAGIAINIRMDLGQFQEGSPAALLRLITVFISVILVLGIAAAIFLVAFIIYQRFYKSIMCDEGYLTFTLPVTTAEILWSKLITAMLWTLISMVTIFLSINIFMLFGTSRSFLNLELYRVLGGFVAEVTAKIGLRWLWPVCMFCLFALAAAASGILHVYLALVLGSVVTQKHKLLAGIGFYFAINIVQGTLVTIVQFFTLGNTAISLNNLNGVRWESGGGALQIYSLIMGAVSPFFWTNFLIILALCAVFFILCHYFLKNKLNLE